MAHFVEVLPILALLTIGGGGGVPRENVYKVTPDCPLLEDCPLNCAFGYATNAGGCHVCECQGSPCSVPGGYNCKYPTKFLEDEKSCNETDSCNITLLPGGCPDITCQTYCKFGFAKGKSGCTICKCNQDPCKQGKHRCGRNTHCTAVQTECEDPPCEWKATCLPACPFVKCNTSCEVARKRDDDDCLTCECKKDFCEGVKCPVNQVCVNDTQTRDFFNCACVDPVCSISCEYGLARDRSGCKVCRCARNPCKFVACSGGYECTAVQDRVCLEKPCPFKAKCLY